MKKRPINKEEKGTQRDLRQHRKQKKTSKQNKSNILNKRLYVASTEWKYKYIYVCVNICLLCIHTYIYITFREQNITLDHKHI